MAMQGAEEDSLTAFGDKNLAFRGGFGPTRRRPYVFRLQVRGSMSNVQCRHRASARFRCSCRLSSRSKLVPVIH